MLKGLVVLIFFAVVLMGCSPKPLVCDDYEHMKYVKGELAILNVSKETVRILTIIYDRDHCDSIDKHAEIHYHIGLEDGHKLYWITEEALSKKVVK